MRKKERRLQNIRAVEEAVVGGRCIAIVSVELWAATSTLQQPRDWSLLWSQCTLTPLVCLVFPLDFHVLFWFLSPV